MKTRRMYMHTIDGKPASFDQWMDRVPGTARKREGQLSYADQLPHWQDRPFPVILVKQLRTIKRQQARSRAFRKSMGWTELGEYGWCVVQVPA